MRKKVTRKQNAAKNCIVCGQHSDASIQAEFYELEDGSIAALATARDIHQSYPGRVHGGMITALLDETAGRAINITEPNTWAVTAEIAVRFKKPVPYDIPLVVTGKVGKNGSRMFEASGQILLPDGTVAAVSTGKYMKMPLDKISDFDPESDEWMTYPKPDDPKEIEIPEKRK